MTPTKRIAWSIGLAALLLAASQRTSLAAESETMSISGAEGGDITIYLTLPPDFDASTAYSVLLSPGDFYWENRPSQPGWIVAVSSAFYGDDRIANSKLVLDWLGETYEVRNGAFHIAGWSANSAGVFAIAMAYPEEFLSVTGIAGMPGRGAEDDLVKLADLHVQFIVGENDTYWRQGSERWFELMQQQGISTTLEIIPNGAHVMPEIAEEPMFERMNALVNRIENE